MSDQFVGNASEQSPVPSVSFADISLYYRESPSAFHKVSGVRFQVVGAHIVRPQISHKYG